MRQLAVRALMERRPDFVRQVIETERLVNQAEIRIEEECLKLLALPECRNRPWLAHYRFRTIAL